MINKIEDFLEKLDKFEYTSYDFKKKLTGTDGINQIEVSYRTELASTYHTVENMPIQLVLHIRINGEYASSWGCADSKENSAAVKWFLETTCKANNAEYLNEKNAKYKAVQIFNSK